MTVIALSGWKQSGKDTSADFLVSECGFTKLSFASVLKDMVSKQYGINRNHCDSSRFKEKPLLQYPVDPQDPFSQMVCNFMDGEFKTADGKNLTVPGDDQYWTPRALCILEGSVKRSVNSSYWVQKVISDINKNPNHDFVISDLRYESEIDQLSKAFGDDLVTIRINRFKENSSNDPSETNLDNYNFNYKIIGDMSIGDLQQHIFIIHCMIKGENN